MPAETLTIHPKYRERFDHFGVASVAAILDLPGDVVSGHPDRHVARVEIGEGYGRVVAYLKREHRIPRRDRPMNALAGFGWVTKSEREATTLRAMADAGLPVPTVLACGHEGGRAFLLLKAVRGALELPAFLAAAKLSAAKRTLLVRRLGAMLARVHEAGFDVPDLSAKHLLIHRRRMEFTLIDLPRSHRKGTVSHAARVRDLAALNATLPPGLVSPRERLVALRAYLGGSGDLRAWRDAILRGGHPVRTTPGGARPQRLRWLDGERLVLTRAFWNRCHGHPPDWLTLASRATVATERRSNVFLDSRVLTLTQSPPVPRWRRLCAAIVGGRIASEDARLAGLLFRTSRHGIPAPRLVAFGRKPDGSGFLLTQPLADTVPLALWLHQSHDRRGAVLHEAGRVLRRLHDARQRLDGFPYALHVQGPMTRRPRVVLADVRPLRRLPRSAGRVPLADLGRFVRALDLTDREALCLVRGYLGVGSERGTCRDLLRELRAGLPSLKG